MLFLCVVPEQKNIQFTYSKQPRKGECHGQKISGKEKFFHYSSG